VQVTPQRRTALASVVAAVVLVAVKLATGLATHSLGLVSEAIHSGTDLVAALLTFFAVGVAARPADAGHSYGHGKAEHLAALAEAGFLVLASLFVAWRAILRLTGSAHADVDAAWYALVVVGVVIAIDLSRTVVSWRAARKLQSAALQSNALHFASDFLGSTAVLVGLIAVRAGFQHADSIAALFVAVLVLLAAARLMRTNVDVLMDRVPAEAEAAARAAIAGIRPPVDLRRLRMREAGGRQFADVVIGVSPDAAVGQGHAAADRVEAAVQAALPRSDVVVHVEPGEEEGIRERAQAAALSVPRVREVHNVSVMRIDGRPEVSLHLKLPGDLTLEDAHAVAEEVERAISAAVPEVATVQTHLEPLSEETSAVRTAENVDDEAGVVRRVVRDVLGREPRELRFLQTREGLVAFITLGLDPDASLAEAHARASDVEARIRSKRPDIADVIVHTEP
jgi:cation diffusion facilitator family transporter